MIHNSLDYLSIAQIIIAVVIIVLVMLQERSSGLSGAFGGGESTFYQTRRGFEKIIFIATVVLVVAFTVLSFINFIL
ncbi:preprotein translocase subunit SecG [Candidatus Wolfebacteria bacterium CG10_big_fil_rev_8_21_14_0_10_31_9]|uniref:Protein-export membrane protein SecG n=1 Tax=Candidatus Wolfebacteria bacterium CG10_big_fil_rev_8_21_14_0_10_31_9 TaxID=1975070 RepID=A0A2H0RCX6_9BACT|nr:MAG: preprotein translocase subunit SecG [Candidatus Wolfebacteria bacterium CG10_big_fil_rev_8_21_14_0_10_31_9]